MRAMTVHHDRFEYTDENGFLIRTTWCWKQTIGTNEKDPITPEDERRLDKEDARNSGRPLKHCKKCVAEKKKLNRNYIPPELGEFP